MARQCRCKHLVGIAKHYACIVFAKTQFGTQSAPTALNLGARADDRREQIFQRPGFLGEALVYQVLLQRL